MRMRFNILHHDRRGQAMVEAALIIPMLLFLLAGLFLMGYWLNAKQVVTAAAREGARAGAQTGDFQAICSAVSNSVQILDADIKHYEFAVRKLPIPDPDDPPRIDPLPARGESFAVIVTYKPITIFSFFRKKYEQDGERYPFEMVTGQAAARMETDPVDVPLRCPS